MKLDRAAGCLAALAIAGVAMGCSPRVSVCSAEAPTSPSSAPSVGTTRLMAADLSRADDAPRVGKSQRSSPSAGEDEKDAPTHRVDRRPGGGFSGYK